MAYIELKDVTYTYPLADRPSLSHVDLKIEKGRFYAVIGANGSGKTTLCNLIRGFIPEFYQGDLLGEVIFDGKPLSEYDSGDLAWRIGYIFQNPFNQITGARDTVFAEIAYGLENMGLPVCQIRERVKSVMETTGIADLKDKNPFELSGGQQQRVAFASVLVLEPDVFVIDEPTSQLDPRETKRVFEIIDGMKAMGKTIILVEHKMELVARYCDEVIVLSDGKLVCTGEKHDVLSRVELLDDGVMLPQAVLLADALRKQGRPIQGNPITLSEILPMLSKQIGFAGKEG